MTEVKGKQKSISLLNKARKQYVSEWADVTAKHFEENEYYKWMADFVSGYNYILEIGTGDGRATLELVRRGHNVVSIEENRLCIRRAKNRLLESEKKIKVLFREKIKEKGSVHKIEYKKLTKIDDEVRCVIIEGDLLNDPKLWEWLLSKAGSFDAVICWLMGTHNGRILNMAIVSSEISNPSEYRLAVQNKVYEISDVVLRKGGILSIVDRGERLNTEELKEDCLNSHRDQASVTTLVVESADYMVYEEPGSEGATKMIASLPLSGRSPDFSKFGFASVISRK